MAAGQRRQVAGRVWEGHARIRTGDYRVIFRIEGDVEIIVLRIADRRDAYAD